METLLEVEKVRIQLRAVLVPGHAIDPRGRVPSEPKKRLLEQRHLEAMKQVVGP
jgi:hypothetical protein